jgi:hypothetical protein
LALALLPVAALIPVMARRHGKRAAPGSRPIQSHVIVGFVIAAIAFAHTLLAVLELGSPEAIGGGVAGLALGALAFMALLAHTGLGLQLRQPKLRRRGDKRRQHITTATVILLAAIAHAVVLLRAAA